jgi:hypothetical protein
MQVGKLSRINEQLLEHSESFGFKSKTEMINTSLTLLKKYLQKKARKKLLEQALSDYSKGKQDNYFESIESDPFESR